jgi:hypothetical protein
VRELLSVLSSSKLCRAFRCAKLAKMGDKTLDESTADRGFLSKPCWREFSMKKGVREDWRKMPEGGVGSGAGGAFERAFEGGGEGSGWTCSTEGMPALPFASEYLREAA